MDIRRKVKNVVYKYSEPEKLVREATSNDPWGPTSTAMNEIADLTFDYVAFEEIMPIIWKRLNDKGKNWRHVYKCITLLEYLVKCGDERVANLCCDNIHTIETLKDFRYFEEHKDLGLGIREKSKALVALLKDNEILHLERQKSQKVKEKLQNSRSAIGSYQRKHPGELGKEIRKRFDKDTQYPKSVMRLNFDDTKNDDDEDEELRRAIKLSKEDHEKATKAKKENEQLEDLNLKAALANSKEEKETMAVLQPPPKVTDESPRYQLVHNHNIQSERPGLSALVEVGSNDPWSSSRSTTRAPEIDLWVTDFQSVTESSVIADDNVWPQQTPVASKSIVDAIFGDDKPSAAQLGAPWLPSSSVHPLTYEAMDLWSVPASDNLKPMTASLGSLTDIDLNHNNSGTESRVLHSTSESDLACNVMKKSACDFLGDNAKLVNLDNLLPPSKAGVFWDSASHGRRNQFGSSTGTNNNQFNSTITETRRPMNDRTQTQSLQPTGNVTSYGIDSHFNSFNQLPQPMATVNAPLQHHVYQPATGSYNNNMTNISWTAQPPPTILPYNHQWTMPISNNATSLNPFM